MGKKQNRTVFIASGIATILLILVIYSLSTYTGSAGADSVVSVILIPKVIDEDNDFWGAITEGAKLVAQERNIDLTIMATDTETDVEGQNRIIEEAIQKKPNAIVLAPSAYEETVPYARKIQEAGIKLVIIDSKLSENLGAAFVATDNVEGGRKMSEYVKDKLDADSVIGIVGHVKGTSTAVEREQGIREGLGQYESQIADVVFCDSSYSKAFQVTYDMIQAHPDMNFIFGLNEYSAVGAARAVKAMGLEHQITMVGFDSSLEEVEMLEAGVFDAIVVQRPMNMGYLGVSMAYQISLSTEMPQDIDSGSVLITSDTIYTEENQKLLFPFRESN